MPNLTQYGFDERVILPYGDGTTKVLVVAEAPGELESRDGIPLNPLAPSGSLFTRLLRMAGFLRDTEPDATGKGDSFRLTNTVWQRPPENRLEDEPWEQEAVEAYRQLLDDEIARFQPAVIIALGNVALRRLTQFGRQTRGTISSVQNYFISTPYGLVLPMLHPASLLPHRGETKGKPELYGAFIWGLKMAALVASKGWVRKPGRYLTHPTIETATDFFRDYNPERHVLSYDIETPKSGAKSEDEVDDDSYDIKRISFCYDASDDARIHAVSMPWDNIFYPLIRQQLERTNIRCSWNGYEFDDPRIRAAGVALRGELRDWWDWHFLCPTLPMGLDYAAPLCGWTGEPWKWRDANEPELYSCVDAHARKVIHDAVESTLKAQNRYEVYHRHCVQLMSTMDKIAARGLPLDSVAVNDFQTKLQGMLVERKSLTQTLVPEEVKNVHPKQGYKKVPKDVTEMVLRTFTLPIAKLTKAERLPLGELPPDYVAVNRWAKVEPFLPTSDDQILRLITYLGAKPGVNRKTKRPTTDAETLKKLIRDCAVSKNVRLNLLGNVLKLSKECRQLSKVIGTYTTGWKPGEDGRIHSTPGLWGAMHRISWRNPNIAATIADKQEDYVAKGFRKCVRAGNGRVLVEADWKGIEAMLVGHLAGDKDFMRLSSLGIHDYFCYHLLVYRRKLRESDIPSLSLSDADLKVAFKLIKKEFPSDRDDAKHIVHGVNYGETPFLISALYEIAQREAKDLVALFFGTVGRKVRIWQEKTLAEADTKHKLRNVWGAEMDFWEVRRWNSRAKRGEGGWELGSEAKSALAFRPRDTAAGMLKETLLSPPIQQLIAEKKVIGTAHDAILTDVLEREAEETAWILKNAMEVQWPLLGNLVVGVEVKCGPEWTDEMKVMELVRGADKRNPLMPDVPTPAMVR
jgi:uracil-DNA glycosylase family 4